MIPKWLEKETFAVQHNPNCPSPYLVRLIGRGAGSIDLKPYTAVGQPKTGELTGDVLGFGKTLTEAAESARAKRMMPNEAKIVHKPIRQDPQAQADKEAKANHERWCREFPTENERIKDQLDNGFC